MASIHSIPTETLSHILALTRTRARGGSNALLSAALVCRHWREPAQELLFKDVHIDVIESDEKGIAWAESPARKEHRLASMTLAYWPRGRTSNQAAAFILGECEGVDTLVLDGDGYADPPEHWDYDELNGGDSDCLQWQFLCSPKFAGLRSLSLLDAEFVGDASAPSDTPEPLPFRLSHLYLWLDDVSDIPEPLKVFGALLDASADSLVHLQLNLSRGDPSRLLGNSFANVGARLRSLTLQFYFPRDQNLPGLLAQCTALEELEICFCDKAVPAHAKRIKSLSEIVQVLPPNSKITHLSLDSHLPGSLHLAADDIIYSPEETAKILIDTITESSLATLRNLSFKEAGRAELASLLGTEGYRRFSDECDGRSIVLRFKDDFV